MAVFRAAPVMLTRHKISYVPVPKNACTSLKTMFFEIENGFPFQPFKASGRHYWIHDLYPSVPFGKLRHKAIADHHRIAVLRDPVKRLLSCYANRVVHHRELSQEKAGAQLAEAGLPVDPDLETFVAHLGAYRQAVGSIDHHAAPMVTYLGDDPGWYARLYRIEETETLAADLRAMTGTDAALERLQRGGPKIAVDTLSAVALKTLKQVYAPDYDVFGAHL